MKPVMGQWKTNNGQIVWVSSLSTLKEFRPDHAFAYGCATDYDEKGNVMGCIELRWDRNGKDIDGMSEWDLTENIDIQPNLILI